jgi:hypothetical protein
LSLLCAVVSLIQICVFAQSAPTLVTQPQSQSVIIGSNLTLSVSVGNLVSSSLPQVSSGTLRLWLKGDAGVVTNSSGQVSEWVDQSGNGNNAYQTNTVQQPLLVNPTAIGGASALRFNGNPTNGLGSMMEGNGDVGLTNALTSFLVYEMNSDAPSEQIAAHVGQPPDYGQSRIYWIPDGDMALSTWFYDYITPFTIPTNTYRIWIDQYDMETGAVELFDNTATTGTNFTGNATGTAPPAAGYYIGGLNPSIQYVVSGRYFGGDIGELIYYSGYLTETDRLAVLGYLQHKYYQVGITNGSSLSFQWQFDGTNMAGATNAALTLTDVQAAEAGTYTVIVTDPAGSTTSSNAILLVGSAPSITAQPQSQEIAQGASVTFTASATGTAPLSYQWYFNGSALPLATNSSLNLTNLQSANGGSYAVTVSNPFGDVVSSNAILSVDLPPSIFVQPQSQGVVEGTGVTFSVDVVGGSSPSLPSVSTGTLQLWLKAGVGVITNGSGRVSQWQDQSGNGNNASQANGSDQPLLVNPAGIGGLPAVRFNGTQDNVNGDYLFGSGSVGLNNAMTTFTVYNVFGYSNYVNVIWLVGVPGQVYGASRTTEIFGQDADFSNWYYDYTYPWAPPTNTYRVWTDRMNTNETTVQTYDRAANSSTNFSVPITGQVVTPAAGYYVGGLNPALEYVSGYNFYGDIAELVFYSGYLSDADRLAVQGYLEQKYLQAAVGNVSYQWQFDGTNISGATNASLTLTDIGTNNAGTYSVIASNLAGLVTSSNAILTVLLPPVITSPPVNQSVTVGSPATFAAAASGTAPLGYQWQFDGTNISGATNNSYTVSNAQITNDGSYVVVVTNPYGSATSPAATLSVAESTIQVVSTSGAGGASVVVSIDLLALGTEDALSLSLDFDPALLTYTGVVLGSGATGNALLVNDSDAATGSLGLTLDMVNGPLAAGTDDVFDVTFQLGLPTNAAMTTISFGNSPISEQISDAAAQQLPTIYMPGTVAIGFSPIGGDVAPRPNGDGVVKINDWVQEGRFVAGLDTISNASEFQRADCAPRATLGDGVIDVSDWVQVGRYAAGLDPRTLAGGPTGPFPEGSPVNRPIKLDLPHPVTLVALTQGSATNTVAVELTAQGNEGAFGFSVTFDPKMVQFVGASVGSGATQAVLLQNTNMAASGSLGFVLGMLAPQTFAAGTLQLVDLKFASRNYSNNTSIAFSDSPVTRKMVDSTAMTLTATYQNLTLAVGDLPWPPLSVTSSGTDLVLSWPAAAAALGLQTAPALDATWSNVLTLPSMIGESLVLTSSVSTNTAYFRLKY